MPAEIGSTAPDFSLRNYDKTKLSLADLHGSKALLVFIPLPFTRVCTSELCDLRDNLGSLESEGTRVVAVTCDSLGSNRAWAQAEGITYPILSDFWPHGEVARAYGCFNEAIGVADRTTYVIDAEGIVRAIIEAESFISAREVDAYAKALAAI